MGAVCHKAIATDSKDNITCMIVQLTGAETPSDKSVELVPGSTTKLGHKGYREAYAAMAEKAGLTLAEAAERRYALLSSQLSTSPTEELREEAKLIGTPEGAEGSKERISWFQKWINNLPEEKDEGPGGMDMASLQNMMGGGGG